MSYGNCVVHSRPATNQCTHSTPMQRGGLFYYTRAYVMSQPSERVTSPPSKNGSPNPNQESRAIIIIPSRIRMICMSDSLALRFTRRRRGACIKVTDTLPTPKVKNRNEGKKSDAFHFNLPLCESMCCALGMCDCHT